MTGQALINGRKRSIDTRDVSYVTQHDVFLGTLSVRETLYYAAHLRLPSTLTNQEIDDIIEDTITKMGLQDCVDKKIGNWHMKGISGGEKRRLSIGVEILTQPTILCLDEPTSGLDAVSSFFVIWTLANIAYDGKIVICSIHQPSIDVFGLFDDLFLISGGEAVYFGEARLAIKLFADAGFPCPMKMNPPDHFLRCITTEFDKIFSILKQNRRNSDALYSFDSSTSITTAEIKSKLIEKYNSSKYASNAREEIAKILHLNEENATSQNVVSASWLKQLSILTRRSLTNMSRDVGYYWLRMVFYAVVAISAGTLDFDIGTSYKSILARGECDGILVGIMICLSLGGLSFVMEELKVSNRERLGGYYGEMAYMLSNFLSSFPFILATSLSAGPLAYCMVNFNHLRFSKLVYFCINIFFSISLSEACLLVAAALVPSPLNAMGIAIGIMMLNYMASPVTRSLSDIPKIFWRYPISYISYVTWAIQGLLKNDAVGHEFDPPVVGQPKIKGEQILQARYGINPHKSKWWDLVVLLCLLIAYKLLFFLALKYQKILSSSFHGLHAKINLSKPFPNRKGLV